MTTKKETRAKLCTTKWHYKALYSAKRHGAIVSIFQAMRFAVNDRGYDEAYQLADRAEKIFKLNRRVIIGFQLPLSTRLRLHKHWKKHGRTLRIIHN